jgi:hypothetical protein
MADDLPSSDEIAELQGVIDSIKEHLQDGTYVKAMGTLKRIYEYTPSTESKKDETLCDCSHDHFSQDLKFELDYYNNRHASSLITPARIRYMFAQSLMVTSPECQLAWIHECGVVIILLRRKTNQVFHASIKRLIPMVMDRLSTDAFSEELHDHLATFI